MIQRRRLIQGTALALAAPALLCGVSRPAVAADRVLHLGNGPDPETLDPHRLIDIYGIAVLQELYEGLFRYDQQGGITLGVASAWEVSADGLEYRFELRTDSRWSDGSPVTADDFVAGWRRLLNPVTRSPYPDPLFPVRNARAIVAGKLPAETLGIVAPAPNRLVVTLEAPQPDFPSYLAVHATVPVHQPSLAAHGPAFVNPGKSVTNGPFRLVERVPQTVLVLEPNPYHADAARLSFDRVYFHVTADLNTELKQFRAGELHATRQVPPSQIDWVRQNLPGNLRLAPWIGTSYYAPNLTREPWKSNRALRQALVLSIDRDQLAQGITHGVDRPLYGVVSQGLPGYTPYVPDYAHWTQAERDVRARALFSEAGYGSDKPPLSLEILINTSELHRQVAVAVASMWQQKLGIQVRIENQEFKVLIDRLTNKSFPDLARRGWSLPTAADHLSGLLTTHHGLGPGYANPAFDAAFNGALRQPDPERYFQGLAAAEKIAVDDAAIIPLFQLSSRHLVSERLEGWIDNPLDYHPVRYLHLK
jgi:oligopeptide transport system substrate-binding protein